MYYYMILVLGPDFSAEEIRAPAKWARSKMSIGSKSKGTRKRRTNKEMADEHYSPLVTDIEDSSDEEWDGEGKGKGKGRRICL
jgi:hypothetical protein